MAEVQMTKRDAEKLEEIKKNCVPNSNKSKQQQPPVKKELKQIAKGKVKKQSLSKKFADTFISDDAQTVKEHVIFDVVVPAVKDIISDIVTSSVDIILFGESGGRSRKGRGRYTSSYQDFYNRSRKRNREEDRKTRNYRSPVTVELDSKEECNEVRDAMMDLIEQYEQATVGDLNEIVGVSGTSTDEDFGWTNLANARVKREHGEWVLELPRPKEL